MRQESNATETRTRTLAVGLGFLGVVGFSGSLPATRVAVQDLDPTAVGLGRAVVAAALAGLYLAVTKAPRPERRHLRSLALVALGVVIGFPLFSSLALRDLPSAHSAVIVGLLPAATAVGAVLRAGERPSRGFWLACGAGLACVLVFAAVEGAGAPRPADALVLAAVALGALGYAEGGALARELGGPETICWALLVSMPLVAPVALVAVLSNGLEAGAAAWTGFVYVSLISMFLGFFAWYRGLALGGVAKIGQVQLVQPVLTLVWAALLLGEDVGVGTVAAALLVLGSVVLTQKTRVGRRAGPGRVVAQARR